MSGQKGKVNLGPNVSSSAHNHGCVVNGSGAMAAIGVLLLLLLLIPTPLDYIALFCSSSIPTPLFILKMFFILFMLFLCNIANVVQRTFEIVQKSRSS